MLAVVKRGVALGMQPAVGGQVFADFALKMVFAMQVHADAAPPAGTSSVKRRT